MAKLQLRVVAEADNRFRWMVVDHVWDGISAPIALSPDVYLTAEAAGFAGKTELAKIKTNEARDHPLRD